MTSPFAAMNTADLLEKLSITTRFCEWLAESNAEIISTSCTFWDAPRVHIDHDDFLRLFHDEQREEKVNSEKNVTHVKCKATRNGATVVVTAVFKRGTNETL